MALPIHGRLGAVNLNGTILQNLYTCPASRRATVTVSFCNKATTAHTVRLAMIDATSVGSVANEDYLEYETSMAAKDVLERSGITVQAGHMLAVFGTGADVTNVNAMAFGIEEDAV